MSKKAFATFVTVVLLVLPVATSACSPTQSLAKCCPCCPQKSGAKTTKPATTIGPAQTRPAGTPVGLPSDTNSAAICERASCLEALASRHFAVAASQDPLKAKYLYLASLSNPAPPFLRFPGSIPAPRPASNNAIDLLATNLRI
jgi:hypothetical protein